MPSDRSTELAAQLAAAYARIAELEVAERARLASRALDGVVFDWEPDTGIVRRFGDLEKLIGVRGEDAPGTARWWQERIFPGDESRSSLHVLSQLTPEQNIFETEFRMRHAAGHWVDLCDRGLVIRNEQGTPIRVVGSTHAIKARRQLERELKDSNARFRFRANILEYMQDAVLAVDTDLNVTYLSPGAERLYSIKASEVLGKHVSTVRNNIWLGPHDEQKAWAELKLSGTWQGETHQIRADGSLITVDIRVNTLPAESGGGYVTVIRDITKHRQQATQLARANQDLLHFAYAVSHDLQAPLRTAISFSQLLELKYKSRLEDQGVDLLHRIVESSKRMSAMLRDLLELAKSAGGDRAPEGSISLEEVLASALADLRGDLLASGATVSNSALPAVTGDPAQLTQLFQNLVGNALKYGKPGVAPHVEISAERRDSDWVIAVRDKGIGFEQEQAGRIFGVFNRLHGAEYSGTGIGLAICKRIVERRGGTIWAAGVPDVGATFYFSIPDNPLSIQSPALNVEPPLPMLSTLSTPTPFDELFQTLDLAQAIVRDLDGKILIWTQGAQRMFGWSKAEAVGRQAHQLLSTEFPQPLEEIQAELLKSGEWRGELKKQKRSGVPVWLASHWALYRDGSGRPQSVIEVNSDISALKEAQDALRKSSEQRDVALRAGHMGVWHWDSRSGVVEWDGTVASFFGLPAIPTELTMDEFRRRVHPDDLSRINQRIGEAFAQGPDYEIEFRVPLAGGRCAWLYGQGQVLRRHGEMSGLGGVVWDVSQRKQEELDRQFVLDISARLSQHSIAAEALVQNVVDSLSFHLQADQCVFGEVEGNQARMAAVAPAEAGHFLGWYRLDAFGSIATEMRHSNFVSVGDTRTDPRTAEVYQTSFEPLRVRAFLAVPLLRNGEWRAFLSISSVEPRVWAKRENELVREVCQRLWTALENIRLLQLTRERQEQFEGTFEQAAVGLAHVALDGRWLRANARVSVITGYSNEELLASRFQDITHPDDLNSDLEQYASLQRGEIRSYSIKKRYIRRDRSIVWINLTVSLVRDATTGQPKYAISVIEDLSARDAI